jgi:cytochrome o ubiquinol oxidase operon protein cyoD
MYLGAPRPEVRVHLVFFLHISSAPDQTNNILALAFGIFVVGLIVLFGSMIIMAHLNHNMMPMDRLLQIQR